MKTIPAPRSYTPSMLFSARRHALTLLALLISAPAALAQATMSQTEPAVKTPSTTALTPIPSATHWPTQDGNFTIPNFRFATGESLPALHLHYLTLGQPHRNPAGKVDNAVLLLHGTGGDAHSLLYPAFSDVLFGPGQPLDITKYFLIFPDDIGHGESSRPSDGLRAQFPQYDYDDMVASQHTMLTDGLHIDHLRLILGTSMGCMQSFVWAETYPGFSDALMPLACLPVQIAGRNRIMRWMAMDAITSDPAYDHGNYTTQPNGLRTALEITFIMGSSPLQLQKAAPTRDAADALVQKWLAARMRDTDANNYLYNWNASRNYDPTARLSTITVPVMWINSADDLINPPELGIAEKMVTRMPRATFVLIPTSDATRGHGTHTMAALWQQYLVTLLQQSAPK
jgi:homoserine O-acetyltransferase